MTKYKFGFHPIAPVRFSKSTGLLLGASLLAIAATAARASTGGGGTPGPGPGPGWTPKWAIGDELRSHNIPDARWRVLYITTPPQKQYQCEFTFAGSTQIIFVDAVALEDLDIYKVN